MGYRTEHLVHLILQIREEIGMPKFAAGDKILYNPNDSLWEDRNSKKGIIIGYPKTIKGIVLVKCLSPGEGLNRTYIQHQDWIREIEKELGLFFEDDILWIDEKNLRLVLKDD